MQLQLGDVTVAVVIKHLTTEHDTRHWQDAPTTDTRNALMRHRPTPAEHADNLTDLRGLVHLSVTTYPRQCYNTRYKLVAVFCGNKVTVHAHE